MKHTKANILEEFKDFMTNYWERITYTFLGIGLTLFVLNISSLLTGIGLDYKKNEFSLSVFLSIILIVYVVHIISNKK